MDLLYMKILLDLLKSYLTGLQASTKDLSSQRNTSKVTLPKSIKGAERARKDDEGKREYDA